MELLVDRNDAGRLLTLERKVPMVVEKDDPIGEAGEAGEEADEDDEVSTVVVVESRDFDLLECVCAVTDPSDWRLPALLSRLGLDGSRFGLRRRK